MWIFGKGTQPQDDWSVMRTVLRAQSLGQGREITPSRRAGILFRPDGDVPFLQDLERRLDPILHEGEGATKTACHLEDDEHGTRWAVLEDSNFEHLVSSTYTVGNAITHNGGADNLIAAVFEFYRGASAAPQEGHDWAPGDRGYWIFRYDRRQFYPFVPQAASDRDRPAELQISRMMRRAGVSVDRTLEEWRPIWGIPF